MIRELIEEIIEKYYRESDEYYSRYREDEDGNDVFLWWMGDENIEGQMDIFDFIGGMQ